MMRMTKMQDTLEVTQLEAAIDGCVRPELLQVAALLALMNSMPLLLEASVLQSLSLGGGRG
jgi:hypothetical protein